MKLNDIHWLAGFIEGEGSFVTNGNRKYSNSKVSIWQKQREPLEKVQRLVGGTLGTDKRGIHYWNASGHVARGIAMTVFSLMSPRRKEQIKDMLRKDTSFSIGTEPYRQRMSDAQKASRASR